MNALLIELRALANLAEALAEENEHHAALTCWQAALDLAEGTVKSQTSRASGS